MIFKGFSEKSKEKYLNKLLLQRNDNVVNTKVESLGVIVNIDEFRDFELFRSVAKELGVRSNNLKIIVFSSRSDDNLHIEEPAFSLKDFGWKGNVKNIDLQMFLEQQFDVLISYYESEILELKLVTAMSKSQFKIGILQKDDRLNDLTIKTQLKDFNVFKSEMFKYLTILNKIT